MPRNVAYILDPQTVLDDVDYQSRLSYLGFLDIAHSSRRVELTDDPQAATIILAPITNSEYGICWELLKNSAFYRAHRSKIIAYSSADRVYPFLPGIYRAISRRWVKKGWGLAGHYISKHIQKLSITETMAHKADRSYLFSFHGSSRTHCVREKIVRLRHPRATMFDSNHRHDPLLWWQKPDYNALCEQFLKSLLSSTFVLCPRGAASASIRLYESMQAGCVPVIVSDKLVLPEGPDWKRFSIRVPEKKIHLIPTMLEEKEAHFDKMGP